MKGRVAPLQVVHPGRRPDGLRPQWDVSLSDQGVAQLRFLRQPAILAGLGTYLDGSIATHCACSPRRTKTPAALPLGSLPTRLLKWLASDTSVLLTASTISPGTRPAPSAGPLTVRIWAPPLMPSLRCTSSGTSTTPKPSALPSSSGSCGLLLSASADGEESSPTLTFRSTVLPRRQTSMSARVPGLVCPTIRGRSDQRLIDSPLNDVM